MQQIIYDWLGHEWIALRAEGRPELDAGEQARDIGLRIEPEHHATRYAVRGDPAKKADRSPRVRAASRLRL